MNFEMFIFLWNGLSCVAIKRLIVWSPVPLESTPLPHVTRELSFEDVHVNHSECC